MGSNPTLSAFERDRALRAVGRAGDDERALRLGAHRVSGSSTTAHRTRGRASIDRLEGAYENLRLIHLPVHASRLNQVELYFSILQRKALTPNDFGSPEELGERLLAFGRRYREIARPFEWTFTRSDLERVLERVDAQAARDEPARARLRLAA